MTLLWFIQVSCSFPLIIGIIGCFFQSQRQVRVSITKVAGQRRDGGSESLTGTTHGAAAAGYLGDSGINKTPSNTWKLKNQGWKYHLFVINIILFGDL